MAVRGIGVDVVKVERLVHSLERFGERMGDDATRRPPRDVIRSRWLRFAHGCRIVADHFLHSEVGRQILIDAPRAEGVNGLLLAQ